MISKQKRFVRAEQLMYARSRLRCRDEIHNRKWKVLMLAGGSPQGEIKAIRELMPKAHITALDNDPKCLEAAIDCGVDDVLLHDLTSKEFRGQEKESLPENERFDLVHLDLCSNPNPITKSIAVTNKTLVNKKGIYIFNFSYGRDVEEMFLEKFGHFRAYHLIPKTKESYSITRLLDKGVSETTCGRILYLFPAGPLASLHTAMFYRGANMPMCSLLFQPGVGTILSVIKVENGDFELAVTEIDRSCVYDWPQEKIDALRRSHAAIKAAYTRKGASAA